MIKYKLMIANPTISPTLWKGETMIAAYFLRPKILGESSSRRTNAFYRSRKYIYVIHNLGHTEQTCPTPAGLLRSSFDAQVSKLDRRYLGFSTGTIAPDLFEENYKNTLYPGLKVEVLRWVG